MYMRLCVICSPLAHNTVCIYCRFLLVIFAVFFKCHHQLVGRHFLVLIIVITILIM